MKLSRITTQIFAVALVSLTVSSAVGQGPGRGRGQGGGFRGGPGGGGGDPVLGLLRSEEVKAELKVTADQEEALKKLAEGDQTSRPDGSNFRDLGDDQRRELFEKMRKEQEARVEEMKGKLDEVLMPTQIERLEQISLQVRGAQALADPKVAEELKITDDQKKQLEEVRESLRQETQDKMREIFGSGDRDAMREQFTQIRQEMEAKVLAVLTSSQQEQFAAMKGAAFTMPEGGFGFAGGRDRGGRGGDQAGRGARGGDQGGRGGDRGARGDRGQRPPAEESVQ